MTQLVKMMSPDFCPPAPGKFSQLVQPPVEDLQAPSGPRHSAREEKELGWWEQKEEQRATEASLNSGLAVEQEGILGMPLCQEWSPGNAPASEPLGR